MGDYRRGARARVAKVVLVGTLFSACGADGEGPPAAAEDSIRAVVAAIAPCVEDSQAVMAGVSVVSSEDDPGAMIVTLSQGAVFSVSDGSSDLQPVNDQAESLLASCP